MKNLFKGAMSALCLSAMLSCQSIINLDKKNTAIKTEGPNFSILFSHSISGETHPCGCRQFPLGGLPQVAGFMSDFQKSSQFLYVDTGDMLFPSSIVPKHIAKSQMYAAKSIAKGLSDLGLKYTLPGDQDLAAGWNFYKEIVETSSFEAIISNLSDKKSIAHKKFVKIEFGKKTIFLTGIVAPESLRPEHRSYFKDPAVSFKTTLEELKKSGYDQKNPMHELVLLSHAGLDYDKGFAVKFPMLTWIIGSHSQSFTNKSIDVGTTQIVQVLSKNHYIGEIKFSSGEEKIKEAFAYHEMREQWGEKKASLPFTNYINNHKSELDKLRDKEQRSYSFEDSGVKKLASVNSCLECHTQQGEQWATTPHSISFASLVNSNEQNKTSCMECHSVGMNQEGGYINHNDLVTFKGLKTGDEKFKAHKDKYWSDVTNAFKDVKSIRKLSGKQVSVIRSKWDKANTKHKVEHSFANVQCLNCHSTHTDHPFDIKSEEEKNASVKDVITNKCIGCHTSDQSPEWYIKDRDGVYSGLNKEYFDKIYKKMAH